MRIDDQINEIESNDENHHLSERKVILTYWRVKYSFDNYFTIKNDEIKEKVVEGIKRDIGFLLSLKNLPGKISVDISEIRDRLTAIDKSNDKNSQPLDNKNGEESNGSNGVGPQ